MRNLTKILSLSLLLLLPLNAIAAEKVKEKNSTEETKKVEKKKKAKKNSKKVERTTSKSSSSTSSMGASSTAATSTTVVTTTGTIFTATNVLIGIAVLGGAAAVAGGGGGGGGGAPIPTTTLTHPETNIASSFATTEAELMEAVGDDDAGMNAYAAYSHGYDGRIFNRSASTGFLTDTISDGNVKVAVIDTGVDLYHIDLDDNIVANSGAYCLYTGCATGGTNGHYLSLSGDGWHGTAVAGIIAAEKNDLALSGHGVAYNAKIIPIKFDFTTIAEYKSLNHAMNQGAKVINASYGLSKPIVDATESDPSTIATTASANSASSVRSTLTSSSGGQSLLQAYQRLVTTETILVYAAGNEYFSQPSQNSGITYFFQGNMDGNINKPTGYDTINPEKYDFTGNIVAAIALNADKSIADFSNRCGVAKEWCLAAPGVSEYSTYPSNSVVSGINGTSFSAPAISGAIAIMAGAFPHLSASEIMNILYDTAEDLGAAGVDEIYGQGLVDLEKATDPSTGGWTLATGATTASISNFETSFLSLSNALGNNLSFSGGNVMFLDKYKKNYYVPLESFSRNIAKNNKNADFFFARKYDLNKTYHIKTSDNTSFNLSKNLTSKIDNKRTTESTSFNTELRLPENKMLSFGFNFNSKALGLKGKKSTRFLTNNLSFSPTSTGLYNFDSVNLTYKTGNISSQFNAAKSTPNKNEMDYSANQEDSNTTFFSTAIGFKPESGTYISLNSGIMIEEDSLLGSKSSGAFRLGDKSTTYYSGLSGEYNLNESTSLFGELNIAFTKVKESKNSLISNFQDVASNSFKIGIKNDNWGIMFSQPFATSSGSANLRLPTSIDRGGNISFSNNNLDLKNGDRETDLEIFYSFSPDFFQKDSIEFNSIYRKNPNNVNVEDEFLGMFKYKMEF